MFQSFIIISKLTIIISLSYLVKYLSIYSVYMMKSTEQILPWIMLAYLIILDISIHDGSCSSWSWQPMLSYLYEHMISIYCFINKKHEWILSKIMLAYWYIIDKSVMRVYTWSMNNMTLYLIRTSSWFINLVICVYSEILSRMPYEINMKKYRICISTKFTMD